MLSNDGDSVTAGNDGDAFTAVQLMEGCSYADAMEVQRGVDAITTRGLVFLVWWIMPLWEVPRDSWCGFVRIVGSPGGSAVP